MSTACRCWRKIGLMCPATMMSEPLWIGGYNRRAPTLIWCAVVSLARTYPIWVNVREYLDPILLCGKRCFMLFGFYDQGTCSLRMLPRSSEEDSTRCSVIFTNAGSMQSGRLYRRAAWVPHTHEKDCSLWPTPRANGGSSAGGSNARKSAIRNGTYVTGKRNPNHTEWLMGFPIGWTEIEP